MLHIFHLPKYYFLSSLSFSSPFPLSLSHISPLSSSLSLPLSHSLLAYTVPRVHQGILSSGKPQDPHAHTHWRATILLSISRLQQVFLKLLRSFKTSEDPRGTGQFCMPLCGASSCYIYIQHSVCRYYDIQPQGTGISGGQGGKGAFVPWNCLAPPPKLEGYFTLPPLLLKWSFDDLFLAQHEFRLINGYTCESAALHIHLLCDMFSHTNSPSNAVFTPSTNDPFHCCIDRDCEECHNGLQKLSVGCLQNGHIFNSFYIRCMHSHIHRQWCVSKTTLHILHS